MTETENTNLEQGADKQTEQEQKATYTAEEVQKMLQSEVDRRISSAQKKWQKDTETRLSEAQKLAKMSDEQKAQHELEQRIKELEDKEKELAIRENKATCLEIMAKTNIPSSLVNLIVHEDSEVMNERLKLIGKAIQEAVNAQVKAKLGNQTPKTGSDIPAKMTKEQYKNLPLAQKNEIYRSNPELWKELNT